MNENTGHEKALAKQAENAFDPSHRSWFAYPNGLIIGGQSHRAIMKTKYKTYWDELKNAGEEDAVIEQTFEKRLLLTGVAVIGELGDFYMIVNRLDEEDEAIIRGFAKAIINAFGGVKDKRVKITQKRVPGEYMECTIGELADERTPAVFSKMRKSVFALHGL